MPDLLAARWLFGLSLVFHIVFAAVGVAMPLLMVLAEARWRRSGSAVHLELARRWAKGAAILFAVGAVSGTVISFELGLLWPRFMAFAGPIIGMPFSLEGFAFFAEAIFLGVYLYGWDRVSPRAHLAAGAIVAAAGAASAFFVTLANAWMNAPAGFELAGGAAVEVRPFVAMFPPGWAHEVLHVLLSSYAATAFAVAGIHAALLLRRPASAFHRAALELALPVAAVAALLQPISGDFSARQVARTQPVKPRWRDSSGRSGARRSGSADGPTPRARRPASRSRSPTASRSSPSTTRTPRCGGSRRSRGPRGPTSGTSTSPSR
jgi:cytochrome d ubiquinol oxidase subunit I